MLFSIALMVASGISAENSGLALPVPHPRLLIFSKTAGFRHDSIPTGIACIENLAEKFGMTTVATEDSSKFNKADLSKFDAVIFLNTTGDILDANQQAAYEEFVNNGGGYVGIHASSDCEYDWPWYGKLVGAYFQNHPAIQPAKIVVEDRRHPSTIGLPTDWQHTDEWYNFKGSPRANVRVLASLDESSYQGGTMKDHPIMWCQEDNAGRSWYTNLGHRQETFADPTFVNSLKEGITWASQGSKPEGKKPVEWKKNPSWTLGKDGMMNDGNPRTDIVSKESYGDALVHLQFRIPAGSNSGVYLQGRYEVQIFDSYNKEAKNLSFSDCGGIYERFVEKGPKDGFAPLQQACRKPGEWNDLDILFEAPKFKGREKIANAVMREVRLNGIVVQKDAVLSGPTGGSLSESEVAKGPLRLQGDHGAITYRHVWIKPQK